MPRLAAWRAYSAVRSGERWAEVTSISYAIPNSSRAFPASRMIFRSESLPITIETSGLLMIVGVHSKPISAFWWSAGRPRRAARARRPFLHRVIHRANTILFFLQRPCRNIFAIVRALKADPRASVIGALQRRFQLHSPRRHPEHSSAGSIESPVTFRGAGMEDSYAVQLCRILEAVDFLARLVGSRITARSHHHAYGRIVRPLEIEPQGAPRGHHQAAIEDAFILRAFGLHAGDDRPHDVDEQPVAHLVINDSPRGVGAHAAGVGAGVAVAHTLVILRGDQRRYPFDVPHAQLRR